MTYPTRNVVIKDNGQEGVSVIIFGDAMSAWKHGKTFHGETAHADAEAYAVMMRDHYEGRHSVIGDACAGAAIGCTQCVEDRAIFDYYKRCDERGIDAGD